MNKHIVNSRLIAERLLKKVSQYEEDLKRQRATKRTARILNRLAEVKKEKPQDFWS